MKDTDTFIDDVLPKILLLFLLIVAIINIYGTIYFADYYAVRIFAEKYTESTSDYVTALLILLPFGIMVNVIPFVRSITAAIIAVMAWDIAIWKAILIIVMPEPMVVIIMALGLDIKNIFYKYFLNKYSTFIDYCKEGENLLLTIEDALLQPIEDKEIISLLKQTKNDVDKVLKCVKSRKLERLLHSDFNIISVYGNRKISRKYPALYDRINNFRKAYTFERYIIDKLGENQSSFRQFFV